MLKITTQKRYRDKIDFFRKGQQKLALINSQLKSNIEQLQLQKKIQQENVDLLNYKFNPKNLLWLSNNKISTFIHS